MREPWAGFLFSSFKKGSFHLSRFAKSDTMRIDLGGEDWVEIRKELGYGDRTSIQEQLMSNLTTEQMMELDRIAQLEKEKKDGVDNGPKAPSAAQELLKDARFNHAAANVETLRLAIVAWGGPGFMIDGAVAAITAENIAALDGTAERILAELKEIMVTQTEGFTKPPSERTDTAAASAGLQGAASTI